jgi:hypothetical protein
VRRDSFFFSFWREKIYLSQDTGSDWYIYSNVKKNEVLVLVYIKTEFSSIRRDHIYWGVDIHLNK